MEGSRASEIETKCTRDVQLACLNAKDKVKLYVNVDVALAHEKQIRGGML